MGYKITIIATDRDTAPVGAQLKEILEAQFHCLVAVVDLHKRFAYDGLIIPVLPSSTQDSVRVLSELRGLYPGKFILPVVRSETLKEIDTPLLAEDFLVSPIRDSEVCIRVKRLLNGGHAGADERTEIEPEAKLTQLVGEDPSFIMVKRRIPRMAQSERTVLIFGETGTGKELCARALHYLSPRADEPFIPVNCGAIPFDLFERELFGHERGAFTGAWTSQTGLLAEAEGGTLFLDEIEALPLLAQVKLLRFLQDQTYCVLGSPKLRQANVRIIASTNVDLNRKIQNGSFREDLYYRLAVLILNLPPLRERSGDIPQLAKHFWKIHAGPQGHGPSHLSPLTLDALRTYAWPGNVRELENAILRLIVLADDAVIGPEDLPVSMSSHGSRGNSHKECKAKAIEQFERAYIAELLHKHNGNVTHAAKEAKKDRRALGRLIKKYAVSSAGNSLSQGWDNF